MDSLKQTISAVLLILVSNHTYAQLPSEDELAISLGDEDFISIATGQKQLVSKAPSVATVITAEEIESIGALDLNDALETVPGLHVSVSANDMNPIFTIRGIYSDFNSQVLLLINGIPITNVFLGNRGQVWGGMPVKNIARIEVIRGPGSAIYGADAFAGVINIITKSPAQIDDTVLGARVGSFNTLDSWLLHSGTLGEWDTAFSLQMHTTEGHGEIVEIDAQTFNDRALGTFASLAPGPVNAGVDSIDTRLELKNNAWKIRLGFQGRYDLGTYAGVAEALDPAGGSESERFNADITYHNPNLNDDWDFTAQASYFDTSAKSDLTLFPPGTDFTGFGGGPFPDGVIGNPYIYERHYRIDVSTFYTGFNHHDIRLGSGYHFVDMYRIKDTRNFTQNEFGVPVPIGNVVNVSDTMPFITEEDRNIAYLSAQDEWSFAPDWRLTAGVRFDDYSDFGGTTNPRAALVWQTRYNMTSKLLYGRAFRAPSFAEQFNINNPVALGNPDLDPETIDTLELAFDFSVSEKTRWSMNIFAYEMDDIIRFDNDPAPANSRTTQNTGGRTGRGVEWDLKWQANSHNSISVNYSFQDSEDEDTTSDTPNAPQQQLYFRHDWDFSSSWSLHTQINHVADRKRAIGDLRDQIDDYTKVDVIIRRHARESHVSAAIYIFNVLDEEIKEPSLAPGAILNDLPQPPRAIFGEIAYHW